MKSHIATGLCIVILGAAAGVGLSKLISTSRTRPAVPQTTASASRR